MLIHVRNTTQMQVYLIPLTADGAIAETKKAFPGDYVIRVQDIDYAYVTTYKIHMILKAPIHGGFAAYVHFDLPAELAAAIEYLKEKGVKFAEPKDPKQVYKDVLGTQAALDQFNRVVGAVDDGIETIVAE